MIVAYRGDHRLTPSPAHGSCPVRVWSVVSVEQRQQEQCDPVDQEHHPGSRSASNSETEK
ncbi:MAG: hypothetical protein FJX77_03910 [Armatimonadetes bacterium]|nr:hypothetical protein [Armatimonadota bacterium]